MPDSLYHLVPRQDWDECKASGRAYFPPTYAQDGFIHLTKEPELLLPVANHFYKDVPGPFSKRVDACQTLERRFLIFLPQRSANRACVFTPVLVSRRGHTSCAT